jgi:hypothetical protein
MSPPEPAGAGPQMTNPQLAGTTLLRAPVPRPRFSAAIGMGGTWDDAGFGDAGAHFTPAFFGTGGIGDGLWGLDFLAFASSGEGRNRDFNPIDRLGLDLFGVVRPAARVRSDDLRYRYRVLRALAGELGLGLERDGRTTSAGTRFVVHTGVRVELPITPTGGASELRIRLGVRRNIGLYTPRIYGSSAADVTYVHDTVAEIYGALVLVF